MSNPTASPPEAGKQRGIALNSECELLKRRGNKPGIRCIIDRDHLWTAF